MASSPQGHIFTCDDQGTLRLCRAVETAGVHALPELAMLSEPQLNEQLRAVTRGSLASCTLTHLFSSIGADGHLRLDASTAAGERLHFVCSVPDESTSGWESKYGFWLQHVAGTWPDQPGPAASQRRACLEEHPDPCCFAPSTLGG
ncbi:unnamed protein product, partial [Effrenium voratum]